MFTTARVCQAPHRLNFRSGFGEVDTRDEIRFILPGLLVDQMLASTGHEGADRVRDDPTQ